MVIAQEESSEESTHQVTMKKTAKSFHAKRRDREPPPRKQSNSFHSSREKKKVASSSERQCTIHPEIYLKGESEGCPKCALEIMKKAAKELRRRAAELELDRKEKQTEGKAKGGGRKERKLVTSSSSSKLQNKKGKSKKVLLSKDEGMGDEEMEAMMRWSTGSKGLPFSGSRERTEQKSSKRKSKKGGSKQRGQFSIGQVARPSHMDEPTSHSDTLIKIAQLKEGDGAWVKRSGDMWTYSILKCRESGPDAALTFTVSGTGGVKKFPVTHWHKFVRSVAENIAVLEEEQEEENNAIDMMMSDQQLLDTQDTKPGAKEEEEHLLEKSLDTFASNISTESDEPVKEFFSRIKEGVVVVEDDEASMYTFDSQVETCLQDHEVSMHTLRASLRQNLKPKSKLDVVVVEDDEASWYTSACLQDHEVSMYTLRASLRQDPKHCPSKLEDYRPEEEDGDCQLRDHNVSMYTLGLQDDSMPPTFRYGSNSKPKQIISFSIPEEDEGVSSKRSSMTSVSGGAINYDADGEEAIDKLPFRRTASMPVKTKLGQEEGISSKLRRGVSLQANVQLGQEKGNESSKHRRTVSLHKPSSRPSNRLSSGQMKEESKTEKTPTAKDSIARKRLSELGMGNTVQADVCIRP